MTVSSVSIDDLVVDALSALLWVDRASVAGPITTFTCDGLCVEEHDGGGCGRVYLDL